MDCAERIRKLDEHLIRHPNDYQAVIARLKTRSDAIDHQMYKRKIYRMKRLEEVRRQRKELREDGKKSDE